MAVAHDAQTRFPTTDTTGLDVTTGDRTFTHTPSGTPKGVVVVVNNEAVTTAVVTGVLYGGVAMISKIVATDTTEVGRIEIFTLTDTSIPTGVQTVTLQGCTADNKWVTCSTVTAGTSQTTVNTQNGANTTVTANPTVTLTTTAETLLYGSLHHGTSNPVNNVAGTGYTLQFTGDYGTLSSRSSRSTSPVAAGSVVYNWDNATSDDWCIAAVALEEFEPGGPPPVPPTVVMARAAL